MFNSTDVLGLGYKVARVAETAGFKVTTVADALEKIQRCLVKSNLANKNNWVTKLLVKKWACRWKAGGALQDKELELIVGDGFF